MNYFDTVKEKIADYIVKEPVVETDEVISAYTLFTILENENEKIRHTEEKRKGLLDKLNAIYPQEVFVEKRGLFNKKVKKNHFEWSSLAIDDNGSRLYLFGSFRHDAVLYKDYGYSDIYSTYTDYALTEDAYNECIDDIEDIFSELEYIGKLFREEKKWA